MAGKKLEAFREWFTPRRRFWAGIGFFVTGAFGPLFYPSLNGYWGCLIGPGAILLGSTWNTETDHKR
ncbi:MULTISPECIES: hypothetical protein [Pseudomonas]|uniref:hypothetical protein n=1 Tax=Pseudomonas TaxID=286 RepID=UPI000A6A0DC5|nr:hypothetical protein [Pseudomonas veronii]WKC47952.1 hypothetical protein QYP03_05790 [Pseudomonas veronii]